MRWNFSHPIVGGFLVAVAIAAVFVVLRACAPPAKAPPAETTTAATEIQEAEASTEAAESTIESSGEVLGVAIGMPMDEARAKLDPLRAPGPAYQPDPKELQSRRILWRLKETEYAWIMVWAGADGKITRVRATLRPDQTKPFSEIGNLAEAAAADATTARWNLRRPDGPNYRLIAQGAEQRASSVSMFSLEMPIKERQEDGEDTEQP